MGSNREVSGSVHISAPADTAYSILDSVLVELSSDYPKLQIILHSSDSLHHLHRDAIDIAIRYGALSDSSLSAKKLSKQPSIVVASPTYLASKSVLGAPSDLRHHRCLTLKLAGIPEETWTLIDRDGRKHDIKIDSPLCADGFLCRQWARAGLGLAQKSLFDVIDDLEEGRLVNALPGYLGAKRPVHAVFPSRQFMSARVRAVETKIREHFAARSERCEAWLRTQNA